MGLQKVISLIPVHYRSQLAATSVSISSLKGAGAENESRDVIPLLCSIFLANHGAGEAAEEGRNLASVSLQFLYYIISLLLLGFCSYRDIMFAYISYGIKENLSVLINV